MGIQEGERRRAGSGAIALGRYPIEHIETLGMSALESARPAGSGARNPGRYRPPVAWVPPADAPPGAESRCRYALYRYLRGDALSDIAALPCYRVSTARAHHLVLQARWQLGLAGNGAPALRAKAAWVLYLMDSHRDPKPRCGVQGLNTSATLRLERPELAAVYAGLPFLELIRLSGVDDSTLPELDRQTRTLCGRGLARPAPEQFRAAAALALTAGLPAPSWGASWEDA